MWDIEPYDNDAAADWLGELMDSTKLREAWCKGISADLDDEQAVLRAAVWLFIQLGHVYVWPIEHYEEDLELTICVAEKLSQDPDLTKIPGMQEKLTEELRILSERRKPKDE